MKKLFSLLLAVMLVLSLSITAYAADSVITFRGTQLGFGFAPGSGYTTSDLFDGFKNVMPGDQLEESIEIYNKGIDCDYIKVYLRADVHDEEGNPLTYNEVFENTDGKDQANISGQRDETVATMQDFLSQLTMRIYNDGELIYESSPDKAGALAEYEYLGTLRYKQTLDLDVELVVPITLDNKYANRVGEVDWVILAECYNDPDELIQTGQLNWPIPVLGSLGILMVFCGFLMMRKKKKNEDA